MALSLDVPEPTPDKPAVIMAGGGPGLDGTVVTFGELEHRSRQVSRLLARLGVQPGDHVAVMVANRPEYFEIGWGAQRRGSCWTPVNWHLTADEAAYIVEDCGATVLFASPETAEVAAQIAARLPRVTTFLSGAEAPDPPGLQSYPQAIAGLSGDPIPDEVEGLYFYYSSGTTGRPKGIRREHAFPPFGTGVTLDMLQRLVFGFGPDTVYLCPAPLYHAAPLGFSLGAQRNGGTVVLMDRFDPEGCLRAIEKYHVTHAQFVPTHFVRMLKLPASERARFDTSSLQTVIHAAAPCPAEVKQQMIDWLGPKLWEYYAGSEGNGITIISSAEWQSHRGSVGRAVGGVHIVDPDDPAGGELPPGEDGLIYFEGSGFEYHRDPAKTAGSRHPNGWSTLGDIGHVDEEGFLYLSDRRTDLIISGGVNIYPAEIEQALVMHPAVADVAVIGVPDPEMGQAVLAVVQPASPATGSPELASELIAHCQAQLASYKCPRQVEFVTELPRLQTGKLLRRKLRERYQDSV